MTPELRDYILTLPLDVRQALASIDEPCWYVSGYEDKRAPAACEVQAHPSAITDFGRPTFGHVAAYVPISPVAIALHAARLSGRDGTHLVAVSVHPCFDFGSSCAYAASNPSPRHKSDVQVNYEDMTDDDSAKDHTGHRAAIALLMKVMQCAD